MAKSPAKKKSPVKAKKKSAKARPALDMSQREIARLSREAAQQKRAEESWKTLTGQAPAEQDDAWSKVEEKLLSKPAERAHSERRWKYFSK